MLKKADSRMNRLSQIDGELFAVKANIKVNSFPFHAGIEFKNNTSLEDDPIIKMIKKNGGIIIGLTNMDEAAFGGNTSSVFTEDALILKYKFVYRSSSGGSAAAISSGLVHNAIGTHNGIVRIPASYCGVLVLSHPQILLVTKI